MSQSKWKQFNLTEEEEIMEEDEWIDLDKLSPKDWAQIRKACIDVYDSQHHEKKDMLKATVAGFCLWLLHAEKSMGIACNEDPKSLH